MAYVVVVSTLINVLALGAAGWILWKMRWDVMGCIVTAIQDEVRKQDDRIEKRAQRASGPAEDIVPTAVDGRSQDRLSPGRPYRRG